MRLSHYAALCVSLLALTACSHTIEMNAPYKAGHYRIKEFVIKYDSPEDAQDADFQEAKALLSPALRRALSYQGKPPEVRAIITLDGARMETHSFRTIMVGDMVQIASNVTLQELSSGRMIGKTRIIGTSGQTQGIFGAAMTATDSADDISAKKQKAISNYIDNFVSAIYPGDE